MFKFVLVGSLNFAVDFLIFMFLTRVMNADEVLAKAISYPIAVVNSFIFNTRYTFKVKMKFWSVGFLKFMIVNILSYGISLLCIFILTKSYSMVDYLASIIATVFSFVVNFAGNKLLVFNNK